MLFSSGKEKTNTTSTVYKWECTHIIPVILTIASDLSYSKSPLYRKKHFGYQDCTSEPPPSHLR